MPADRSEPFESQRRRLVAACAQVMLPATQTPGAIEAGVPAFVERMVREWYSVGERRLFLAGLDALNEEAFKRYKTGFPDCSQSQQQLLLRQAESAAERANSALLDASAQKRLSFFAMFKELAVIGFFSSELASKQVLRHPPSDGQYIADYPIDDETPQWSSLNGA